MNTISQRSKQGFGALVVLVAAALAGCAATGGAVTTGASHGSTTHRLATQATAPSGYIVCAGGSASRFPEREESGRICRNSVSLHAVY